VGENLPVGSLNRDHMRSYFHAQLNLPRSRKVKKYRDKPLKELAKLDLPLEERLSGKTLETRFINIRSFLNWLEKEDHIDKASKLNDVLTVPKERQPPKKLRTGFTPEELRQLFDHPGFTGEGFRDSNKFWVPLIALHTGARIEEICQLHLSDIRLEEEVWVFDINDKEDKSVKTQAGKRIVPIHPVLVELGLLERVESLKSKGQTLLFPKLKPRQTTGKYSGSTTQWFTRHRRDQGIPDKDPKTNLSKSFHSFRHTVINRLMVEGVDRLKYKHVVGHEGKEEDVTDLYEGGFPIKTLYEEVILKLDFSESLDVEAMKNSKWIREV